MTRVDLPHSCRVSSVETDSAATVIEGIAPLTPFFKFDVKPAVEIQDAVPIFQKINDWRDSLR